MTKKKYIIAGVCFFIIAFVLTRFYEPKPALISITQTSGGKTPYLYEGIVKGVMAVQEITTTRDYLNGLSIRFATLGHESLNTNALVIFDSTFTLVYQQQFTSKEIEDTKYHDFPLGESKKVGKGNKLYVCLISKDGDSANSVHGLFNSTSKLGKLYASVMVNDDLVLSVRNKARIYPGSLMMRTFESDTPAGSSMKNLLFLAIVLVTLVICFFPAISRFLAVIRILPEYAYLTLALIFGLLFVFLTPPGQVPDEGSHLSRSAELSEFQFSNHGKTIPASFLTLDSTFVRIHFSPDERTSQEEILSMAKIRLNPEKRHESSGPDYTVPYIPQVLGIFIGRIFTSTPLFLMYFGRLFNLLIAVVVIFFAIRITPMAKWVILLLALMPKTLFMLGSMSYDATVISCSFLLIALYLFYAYKSKELLGWKDLGLLFVISILVALCKPPYFLIGFLFLLIPVGKIGSWIKYLVVFSVFVISMLLAQGMWSLLGGLVKSADAVKTEQATHEKSTTAIPAAQPAVTGRADAAKPPAADTAGVAKTKAAEAKPQKQAFEINPGKQVNYLKTHVPEFIGLLYTTNFVRLRADMLNNFVGTMGWLDVFLPNILVDLYLALLLIAALCIAEEDAHIGWKKKVLLSGLFLIGVLAIETAMYIYSTVVGFGRLYGIQGRYFIPLAPLFLLVFYNTAIPRKLNFIFSPRRKSYEKAKPKMKPQILAEIEGEQLFTKYLQVVILLFATVVLVRGIAAVLLRYYQW